MRRGRVKRPEQVGIRSVKFRRIPQDLYVAGRYKGKTIAFTDGTRYEVKLTGQMVRL